MPRIAAWLAKAISAIFGTLPIAVPAMKSRKRIGVQPAAALITMEGRVGTRRITALAQKPWRASSSITMAASEPARSSTQPAPSLRPRAKPSAQAASLPVQLYAKPAQGPKARHHRGDQYRLRCAQQDQDEEEHERDRRRPDGSACRIEHVQTAPRDVLGQEEGGKPAQRKQGDKHNQGRRPARMAPDETGQRPGDHGCAR